MATKVDELIVEIKAETAGLRRGLGDLDKKLTRANKTAGRSILSFGNLAKAFAAVGAARMAMGIVQTAREFEDLGATMRAVTGSAANANLAMETIKDFTSTTPFQLNEVTGAFIKFYQAGIEPTGETLKSFGNLAAGMGKPIETLAQAVFNATTGEMEMLKQFGIKAKQMGDEVSFNFEGTTTVVKNNREAIAEYIEQLGATRFPTALAERLNTMSGSFANLQDKVGLLANDIGEKGLNKAMTDLSNALQGVVDEAGEKGLAGALATALSGALEKVTKGIIYATENIDEITHALKMAGIAVGLFMGANIVATLITSLTTITVSVIAATKAVWAFTAALLANPFTWLAMAIAAIVAAIVVLYKNWERVTIFFENTMKVRIPNAIDTLKMAFVGMKIAIIGVMNSLLEKLADKVNKLIEMYNKVNVGLEDIEPVNFKIGTEELEDDRKQLQDAIDERLKLLKVYSNDAAEIVAEVVPPKPDLAPKDNPLVNPDGSPATIKPQTGDGIDATTQKLLSMKEAFEEMKPAIVETTNAFTKDFTDALLNGENALDSFKDFAKNMVSQIIASFMQLMVIKPIMDAIMMSMGMPVTPTGKAGGGTVQAGKPVLVGERGAELFVPNTGGKIVNNHNLNNMGGGATTVINQNINFATGVVPTVRAEVMKMMPQIAETTKGAVAEASLRGGSYRKALAGG